MDGTRGIPRVRRTGAFGRHPQIDWGIWRSWRVDPPRSGQRAELGPLSNGQLHIWRNGPVQGVISRPHEQAKGCFHVATRALKDLVYPVVVIEVGMLGIRPSAHGQNVGLAAWAEQAEGFDLRPEPGMRETHRSSPR